MNSRDALVPVVIFAGIATAAVMWTPLDVYTSVILAGIGLVLLTVPQRSIAEGLRLISDRTGVNWTWWALFGIVFLAFVNGTRYLGAPDILVECSSATRSVLCPTGYGIGTLALFFGGILLVFAGRFTSTYRTLLRQPPDESPSTGQATVTGVGRPEGSPLQTPVKGERALWYDYEVAERQNNGIFNGCWLPVDSGERSTRWSVTGAAGWRQTVDGDDVRLLPTRSDANVRVEECTVSPDESLPAGIARLNRAIADGGPDADRTTERRYRVWYVPVDEPVVAHGGVDSKTLGSGHLRSDGTPVYLGVGTTYDDLCSTLAGRAVLTGGLGLVLTGIGVAIVAISL